MCYESMMRQSVLLPPSANNEMQEEDSDTKGCRQLAVHKAQMLPDKTVPVQSRPVSVCQKQGIGVAPPSDRTKSQQTNHHRSMK